MVLQYIFLNFRTLYTRTKICSSEWKHEFTSGKGNNLFSMMSVWPENQKTWKPVSKLWSVLLFYMSDSHPPITRKESWLLPHLDWAHYKVHSSTRDVLRDKIFYDLHGKCEIPRDQISNMVAVCRRNGSLDKYNLSWVTVTEAPLETQPLLMQKCVSSVYKISAAMNTVLKMCKPWALS